TDPLSLLLWALALSASALFPVLFLAIWWKRLNAIGALAGMVGGFGVALLAIVAGEATSLGLHSTLAGVLGMPAGFLAAIGASMLGPEPSRQAMELLHDVRIPGGETVHD